MSCGPRRLKIALVGSMQQENLALGYLAAAAEMAGHETRLVRYDGAADLASTSAAILDDVPDLVGLGIPFQYGVGDAMHLATRLRRSGYSGHITCGGHVPTFCGEEILRDCPAIDTAVRHEGECSLVAIADALGRGEEPRGIPGLVWREGEEIRRIETGGPVDVEATPWPKRPEHALSVGGVNVAFLSTSRGCIGECAYCSIRAFGRDMGGPRFRMRPIESVADEIAALHDARDVRLFFVQDDLFILTDERKTIERMEALTCALHARGVRDAFFWIKGRPESITEAVLGAARGLGAIHVFLGIESGSDDRLLYLGRTHRVEDNVRALELCRRHGVRPSFNFMMFDPDCTLDDVAKTIDLAAANPDLPWNLCRTEVYSGTRLFDRLREEGRLQGDYRCYGYRMRDDRCEVMFRILRVCLDERAFAFESLLNKLISLSFARQVHEALFPGPGTERLSSLVDALVVEAHEDTVRVLREVLAFVERADLADGRAVTDMAVALGLELGRADAERFVRAERLWSELGARGRLAFRERLRRDPRSSGEEATAE